MIRSMNMAWCVQRWSELHPQKTAILFEDHTITYQDLHRLANRDSCWLQSLGIEKGDRVAVLMNNCPEFFSLYLACSRIGAIFVPINTRLADPELKYILDNARPRLLVFHENFINAMERFVPGNNRTHMYLACIRHNFKNDNWFDYHSEVMEFVGKKPFVTESLGPADPEEPHVIMYTSGTTGLPKGAVLSHRKTFFNCLNAEIFFKLQSDDIMLIILPLFHSGGLFIQASPILYKGGTMVIHPKFDPTKIYTDFEKYRVTKFLGVPTVYRSLIQMTPGKETRLSSLKVCAIGGEKTTPELLKQCRDSGFHLRQIMGQTETSILLWASEEDSIRKPGTVGKPVFHSQVKLVDKSGRKVAQGEVGELLVKGSIMMKEYWMDPIKTEETIVNGWLHTGDLARIDEEGFYYLVDRTRDMYISGGENIYPAEVERILKEHKGVKDAAVIGVEDDQWGEVGKAFVIREKEAGLSSDDLISFCDGRLARFKRPRYVVFCRDFPRTALGKVRKTELNHFSEQFKEQDG